MTIRSLIALLALIASTLTVGAADDEHPYKKAKVGDFAKYSLKAKFGGLPFDGNVVQTVTARTQQELTLKVTLFLGDAEVKGQEMKLDVSKPFDPSKGLNVPGAGDLKLEKLKDGKEKVTVDGKEYDAKWTTYKVSAAGKTNVKGDLKVWVTKDLPIGLLKLELNAKSGKNDLEVKTELTEYGSKK